MQYYRCKCGKCEYWGSGETPKDCQGCKECGTTYAQHPDDHKTPIAHDWEPRHDSKTGVADTRLCRRCHKVERVELAQKLDINRARALLAEAAQQFRQYEANHIAKTRLGGKYDQPGKMHDDTLAKAKVNAEFANKIERFLASEPPEYRIPFNGLSMDQAPDYLKPYLEGFGGATYLALSINGSTGQKTATWQRFRDRLPVDTIEIDVETGQLVSAGLEFIAVSRLNYPFTMGMLLELAYANDGINRDRPAPVYYNVPGSFEDELPAIEKALADLSHEDLMVLVDGEEREARAIADRSPGLTFAHELLEVMFGRI